MNINRTRSFKSYIFDRPDICQVCRLVFQQTIGILMGTNCPPPPFADLFLHAYVVDFLQWLLKNKDKKIPQMR